MIRQRRERCLYCNKKIGYTYPSEKSRKFCNRRCYMKYRSENPGKDDTLCWSCKNTNGIACSWFSESMTPVEGWTAEKVFLREKDGYVCRTYKIIACPNFLHI